MKFAHLADCHLGGWRQPEILDLNFRYFKKAIDCCIKEKVDFILIAGDLFDSAYPPIETLKLTFEEFRKINDAGIPVFLIAGSHDYSVSGKTFLDVLEKSGFCKNVSKYEEKDGKIVLLPENFGNIAIYGYPGKKSGLEVEDISRIILQDSPGLFKILMLHTAIQGATTNPQIVSVDESKLPKVDYIALGHLHASFHKGNAVYPGPTFPNNLLELEELRRGSFCIFDNGQVEFRKIKLKEIFSVHLEINNSLKVTENLISLLDSENLTDKIVIVRLSGVLEKGRTTDIDFDKIESFAMKKGAYCFLKSTSRLYLPSTEIKSLDLDSEDLESKIISRFKELNPSPNNNHIKDLIAVFQAEKLEDEKASIFEERILSETKKVLKL